MNNFIKNGIYLNFLFNFKCNFDFTFIIYHYLLAAWAH